MNGHTRNGTDIVFISRVEPMTDACDPALYTPMRMEIDGQQATVSFLRKYAGNDTSFDFSARINAQLAYFGGLPVLTPYLLESYFHARGISFEMIPYLYTGWERLRALGRQRIMIIAISTTWSTGVNAAGGLRQAAALIKKEFPGVLLVAGGVGVQKGIYSRRLLEQGRLSKVDPKTLSDYFLGIDSDRDRDFDCIIFGSNPEGTLKKIIECIRSGEDFRGLPNIAIPHKAGYRVNDTADSEGALSTTVINWRNHYRQLFPLPVPVYTSEGCPFRCEFCDFFQLLKPRLRSEDNLLAELKSIKAMPFPRRIFFTDDNIGISKPRLKQMLKAMIRQRLGVQWCSFLRADIVDEEVACLLRDSGCAELLLGIESADPGVLANMHKQMDPEKARQAIVFLDRCGINIECTLVVGFPGENRKSIDNTIAWVSGIPSGNRARAIHRYYLFRFVVSSLSPVGQVDRRQKYGLEGFGEVWTHATMNSTEAGEALKEMFLKINGPTHGYIESLPFDWPPQVTREILETRERAQKALYLTDTQGQRLQKELVQKVREANKRYALHPVSRGLARLYYRLQGIEVDGFHPAVT